MAITTQDGLISAIAAGSTIPFMKSSATTVAGFNYTLFRIAGSPGAAAIPSTAAGQTLSRTSTGALAIPAASNTSYLSAFQVSGATANSFVLADRLVETGTLSGTVTTAQTINSTTLPTRASSALDVELWLEILTAAGTTASATVTCSYTNQAGTASRTATLIGGIPSSGTPINRSYQFSLQAGDTGVQSVQTFTSTTSTLTAGALGIVLRRSLARLYLPVGGSTATQGYPDTDLVTIPDDACLELLVFCTVTNSGLMQGSVGIAQG